MPISLCKLIGVIGDEIFDALHKKLSCRDLIVSIWAIPCNVSKLIAVVALLLLSSMSCILTANVHESHAIIDQAIEPYQALCILFPMVEKTVGLLKCHQVLVVAALHEIVLQVLQQLAVSGPVTSHQQSNS